MDAEERVAHAIDLSVAEDRIVTLDYEWDVESILIRRCDNFVKNGPVTEFWGRDWRVHMTTKPAEYWIAVAAQDAGTCAALRWAWTSIEPLIAGDGGDEDEARDAAVEELGHDEIVTHRVR